MSQRNSREVILDVEDVHLDEHANASESVAEPRSQLVADQVEAEAKWKCRSANWMLFWVFAAELLVLAGHLGIAHHHRKDPLAMHYQMSCIGSLAAFGLLFFRNFATWRAWRFPLVCVIGTTVALAMLTLR